MDVVIETENVVKKIRGETILRDINLSIYRGEFVSITGASGSGKSSLLYILGLLDSPTYGKVYFDGKLINFKNKRELAKKRNRKIGFVFQFHYLLPEFTAIENVMIPMVRRGESISNAREKSFFLLEKVGLRGKEYRKPYQLSGGEQQRVAIARALSNNPSVILADEPTGNLDSKNTEVVMDIFLNLNKEGTTIVMVTHEQFLAKKTHRIFEMKDGRIIKVINGKH